MENLNHGKHEKDNRRSFLSFFDESTFKSELAAAGLITILAVIGNGLINLFGFVYWFSFFQKYNIPVKYIGDAVHFNSNSKTYILLLLPLACIVRNAYSLIKHFVCRFVNWFYSYSEPEIESIIKQKKKLIPTISKDRSIIWRIILTPLHVLKYIAFFMLSFLVFLMILAAVFGIQSFLEKLSGIYWINNGYAGIPIVLMLFILVLIDILKECNFVSVIASLFKRNVDGLVFFFTLFFLFSIGSVLCAGSLEHNVMDYQESDWREHISFIETEAFNDSMRKTLDKDKIVFVDLILFEAKEYYYTRKIGIMPQDQNCMFCEISPTMSNTYKLYEKTGINIINTYAKGVNYLSSYRGLSVETLDWTLFICLWASSFCIGILYIYILFILDQRGMKNLFQCVGTHNF